MGCHNPRFGRSLRLLVSPPIQLGKTTVTVFAYFAELSRTPWKSDDPDVDIDIESLRVNGYIGEDGYVNVANQFGMSEERGMDPSL